MVKTLIIMRFGAHLPFDIEKKMLMKIIDTEVEPNAVYTPIAGGILSIIRTELSPAELTEQYRMIFEKNQRTALPVIIIDPKKDGTAFWLDACPNVKRLMEQFNIVTEKPDSVDDNICHLTLDQLLDLISKKGLKKLSAIELEKLKELSGNK